MGMLKPHLKRKANKAAIEAARHRDKVMKLAPLANAFYAPSSSLLVDATLRKSRVEVLTIWEQENMLYGGNLQWQVDCRHFIEGRIDWL